MITITDNQGKAIKLNIDNIAILQEKEKSSMITMNSGLTIEIPQTVAEIEVLIKQIRIGRYTLPKESGEVVEGTMATSENTTEQ